MSTDKTPAQSAWVSIADQVVGGHEINELFVLCEGLGEPHTIAASEVLEQALRAYRLLRMKKFYLRAPKRCLRQIMNQAGRTIWRLKKRYAQIDGEVAGIIITHKHWWAAGVGNMRVYVYRKGGVLQVLPKKVGETYATLGHQKIAQWEETEGEFFKGDILLLLNKNITLSLNQSQIANILSEAIKLQQSVQDMAKLLVEHAQNRRKHDGYGVLLIYKP